MNPCGAQEKNTRWTPIDNAMLTGTMGCFLFLRTLHLSYYQITFVAFGMVTQMPSQHWSLLSSYYLCVSYVVSFNKAQISAIGSIIWTVYDDTSLAEDRTVAGWGLQSDYSEHTQTNHNSHPARAPVSVFLSEGIPSRPASPGRSPPHPTGCFQLAQKQRSESWTECPSGSVRWLGPWTPSQNPRLFVITNTRTHTFKPIHTHTRRVNI